MRIENWPAVICGGWKFDETLAGNPETESVASPEKPFVLASET